jgi:regulator of protease activity HflC (stomatin/prohibitin superfamily)
MKAFRKLIRYTIYTLGVIFAVILVLVGVTAISGATFKVEPYQVAIVLRTGEPKREVGPGLQWKYPFESVYYCDVRTQDLELTTVEAQLSDLTRISIDASVSYGITDCVRFFFTARSPEGLRKRLSTTLTSNLRETLGRYSSPDFSDKRNEIVTDVKAQMNAAVQSSGASLMDVNLFFSKP